MTKINLCVLCGKPLDLDGEYACVWAKTGADILGFAHLECADKEDEIDPLKHELSD